MTQAAGKRDETTDFEWFMLEFHRIDGCEHTKAKILKLIKAQAGKVIRFNHRILSRPYQVERARQLLAAGNDRPVTRDRLVSELGCSTRKAYMLIEDAINIQRAGLAREFGVSPASVDHGGAAKAEPQRVSSQTSHPGRCG